MKNNRLINVILILMLLLNIAFVGSWWYNHWKSHKRKEHNNTEQINTESRGDVFLVKELNLDRQQQDELESLRKEHFQKMEKLETSYYRNEKNVLNALSGNSSDSSHAFVYADSAGMLKAAMQKELFRNFREIRKICKADQSSKFDEVMEKMAKELQRHRDALHEMRRDSL